MHDLRAKTVSGVGWSGLARFASQTFQFAVSVALARILVPEDFGLLGMVIGFTAFITLFGELGFTQALVQKAEITEADLSSSFWLNVAVGTLLTVAVFWLAPAIAAFYGEDRLVGLTRLLAVGFVLGSLNVAQMALLNREMDFRFLAVVEIATVVLSGTLAIVLACVGSGVWALAWQRIAAIVVRGACVWWRASWRPSWCLDRSSLRQLWSFGGNFIGFQLLNTCVRTADNLVIGRFVGSTALGLYSRAYQTMLMPTIQVTRVFNRVMFSALSRVQDQPERMRRAFLQSARMIALLAFPLGFGLLVTAETFVVVVYGEQWRGAIPVLQILCLIALKQPVGATRAWVLQSLGRTDLLFRFGLVNALLAAIGFAIGLRWGILGIATAHVIRVYVTEIPLTWLTGRSIGLSLRRYYANLGPLFGVALAMASLVWSLELLLRDWCPLPWLLVAQIVCGGLAYLGMIHLFRFPAYREVVEMVAPMLKGNRDRHGEDVAR